jgi:large subunit ribosomal protein L4
VALSELQRRGRVVILDELKLDTPSTRVIREAVERLGVADGALIVTADTDRVALKSAGNLPNVEILAARLLNPLDAYRARNLIVTQDALVKIDELWGEPFARPARKPAAA